jgi:hypothetical protein
MSLLAATVLTKDTASADLTMSGGTAFTDASSHTFYLRKEGRQLLLVDNTYAGVLTVTVAAGGYLAAGKGAMTFTLAQGVLLEAIDISSDRFKAQGAGTDATGTDVPGVATITFSTSGTGFVRVISLP